VIQPKGYRKAIYHFDIFRFRAAFMDEFPSTEGLQPFVAIGPGTRRGWITGRRGEREKGRRGRINLSLTFSNYMVI
jgi:hypothetical protein